VAGLVGRTAVLLGNHGMITVGADLDTAMRRAAELETLARMYLIARSAGRPTILSDEEIAAAVVQFESYGIARPKAADGKHGKPKSSKLARARLDKRANRSDVI
jgi:L-fuculose-phosphate aldolase